MIKKITLIIAIFILSCTFCYSQMKLRAIVAYDYSYGIPVESLHSFISGKAFDGVHFHSRLFIQRNFSVGLSTGWNNFKKEYPRAVYETDKGTVSAVQTRYFHSFPFLVTGYYYLRSSHFIMPYAGGGIGGYWLRYEKWFGPVEFRNNSFRFGINPEVGVIVPFGKSGLGLIVNGKFNKVFYSHEEIKNLNYFEATIGLYFGYPVFSDPAFRK